MLYLILVLTQKTICYMSSNIIKGVSEYYSNKIIQHGSSSLGVDWNSKESQYLRFAQLAKVFNDQKQFSVLDYGCGYAELVNYLLENYSKDDFSFFGYDISDKMIEKANFLFGKLDNVTLSNDLPLTIFDFVVASGIFNVKLELANEEDWLKYIIETLHSFDKSSRKGFSFNALTKYSDKEFMKDYLYYSDPLFLFDYCKRNFSRNVALLHDYNLYEFTIIVRK